MENKYFRGFITFFCILLLVSGGISIISNIFSRKIPEDNSWFMIIVGGGYLLIDFVYKKKQALKDTSDIDDKIDSIGKEKSD